VVRWGLDSGAPDRYRREHWWHLSNGGAPATASGEIAMSWKRPKIREICIGMEINGYLPADL
jgi:coenzyme PQQ precursor peptide PqqA